MLLLAPCGRCAAIKKTHTHTQSGAEISMTLFLVSKKGVWFYWECLLISCVFQLILVKLLIVFFVLLWGYY